MFQLKVPALCQEISFEVNGYRFPLLLTNETAVGAIPCAETAIITFLGKFDLTGPLFGPFELNRGLRQIKRVSCKFKGANHLAHHTNRAHRSVHRHGDLPRSLGVFEHQNPPDPFIELVKNM